MPTQNLMTPVSLIRRITTEMERFFDGFDGPRAIGDPSNSEWIPKLDVVEKNGALTIDADLPGMTPKDVTVEVADGQLTIKGERKSTVEQTKDGVYRRERSCGTFLRTLPLPEGVTPEQIKASFANGVLEVTVPLPPAAKVSQPQRIAIEEPAAGAAKTAA